MPRRTARPKWWDPRIIGGLVLVIAAVVIGAKVVGSSSRTTPVWSATRDLAAGTVLQAADLAVVEVNLGGQGDRYVSGGTDLAGRTVGTSVHAGELLPAAVLSDPMAGRVLVIGVSPDRMPPGVQHGSRIDLYLTVGSSSSANQTAASTSLIAPGITVQSVNSPSSGGLSGAGANRYQIAVLLEPVTADKLVRILPTGDPTVVLVSGK